MKIIDFFRRDGPIEKRTHFKYRGPGFALNTLRMTLYIFLPVFGMGIMGHPYLRERLFSPNLMERKKKDLELPEESSAPQKQIRFKKKSDE